MFEDRTLPRIVPLPAGSISEAYPENSRPPIPKGYGHPRKPSLSVEALAAVEVCRRKLEADDLWLESCSLSVVLELLVHEWLGGKRSEFKPRTRVGRPPSPWASGPPAQRPCHAARQAEKLEERVRVARERLACGDVLPKTKVARLGEKLERILELEKTPAWERTPAQREWFRTLWGGLNPAEKKKLNAARRAQVPQDDPGSSSKHSG
jgi:hypothetical protein